MKFLPHATFFLILAALLVGQRFGFSWAGGTGYEPPVDAMVTALSGNATADRAGTMRPIAVGDALRRGERVATDPGAFALLAVGRADPTLIALDERTALTLEVLAEDAATIRLHAGRVATQSPATRTVSVATNFTLSIPEPGRASFVNYDFLETIAVIPLDGKAVTVNTKQDAATNSVTTPVSVHETDPVSVLPADFNAFAPTVSKFYAWTFEHFDVIR